MPVATDAAGEQAWNAEAMRVRPVGSSLRTWFWPRPGIVLGCGQRGLLDTVRNRAGPGVEVIVREAGGGAVLVGPWLIGLSLVLPATDPRAGRSPSDGYRWLSLRLAEALRQEGCEAQSLSPETLEPPGAITSSAFDARQSPAAVSWACFGSLSAWEIADARGRKLVGLAQRRTREAVLLVAGILAAEPDWALLCKAMDAPDDVPRLRALTATCLPEGADAMALARRIERAVASD